MSNHRLSAVAVGALFFLGTAAGVASVALSGPVFAADDVLSAIAANPNPLRLAALMVLTMGFALAFVPIVLYPIFRRYNETLAIGYIVFRGGLETTSYFATALSFMLLVGLSAEPNPSQSLATLLATVGNSATYITTLAFSLGALLFYTLLYQTRLIPRWLSIWGLIAIIMHIAAGLLAMFAVFDVLSPVQVILNLPIFFQELVMAVYLIIWGFYSAVLPSDTPGTATPAYAAARQSITESRS